MENYINYLTFDIGYYNVLTCATVSGKTEIV
jgi:hypothetical protein